LQILWVCEVVRKKNRPPKIEKGTMSISSHLIFLKGV
jgi:hypothetical protein